MKHEDKISGFKVTTQMRSGLNKTMIKELYELMACILMKLKSTTFSRDFLESTILNKTEGHGGRTQYMRLKQNVP